MIAVTFKLRLKEPLLMTTIEGDPNSAVSLPYVPGSALRGALVGRYLSRYPTEDLAGNAEGRRLFFSGETRYLNAYPVDVYGERTLPTPQAWRRRKGDRDVYTAYDLSVDPRPAALDGQQHKAVRQPFCSLSGAGVDLYDVEKQIAVHTLRDQQAGRALGDGQGAIFRYEALAPDQTLAGAILCDELASAEMLRTLLEQDATLLLGGSHSAGYGLVEIEALEIVEDWQEVASSPTPNADGYLTVTLISDTVLHDDRRHPTAFLTPDILRRYLGVELTLDRARTFAVTGVVGGFNRKWGLPLPQTAAARSGSVFTFETGGQQVPAEGLQRLIDSGIGERRAEGFGRVAINWHAQHSMLQVRQITDISEMPTQVPELTGESAQLAAQMAGRMLRRQLDTALRERVLRVRVQGRIRNTQLSAIRTLVRTALSTGEVAPITVHLDEMKAMGQQQFEQARIDGHPADDWLRTIVQEDAPAIWLRLQRTSFDATKVPAVGGERAEWTVELAREYALRLIDGVLSRELAQRRKEA